MSRPKLSVLISIIIMLVMLVLSAIAIVTMQLACDKPEPASEDAAETPPPITTAEIVEPTETPASESTDEEKTYIDKLIFIGDSTTYGLKYYGVLSEGKSTTQVWTPSSGTLALL